MTADRQLEWVTAFNRYVSTVHTGGTPEQRAWAWARADAALDNLMLHEQSSRASRDTEELETA